MKVYITKEKMLSEYWKTPNPSFWNEIWDTPDLRKEILSSKKHGMLKIIRKYLPKKSRILEGGCGKAQLVYCLNKQGYESIGVDYADKTVKKIKKAVPELDIRYDDVRHLKFPDNYFDGYVSLGVIEHFKGGYEDIIEEMKRVLKKKGILFLSFPYMSPFRKIKASFGLYPLDNGKKKQFYQFILNHKSVVKQFEDHGFKPLEYKRVDGIKGFKDEVSFARETLQEIYDYKGKNRAIKGFRIILNALLTMLSAHCILIVLQKKK